MGIKTNFISTRWICEAREAIRSFLDEINFADPERHRKLDE